jgi:hypothetical protein
MRTLVYIRVEQLKSLFSNRGTSGMRRFILFVLAFLLCIISIWTLSQFIYMALACALLLILHLFRNDFRLLKKLGFSVYTIILFEYLILAFPFIFAGIILHHPSGIALLLAFILLLPLTHPPRHFRIR